MNTSKTVFGEIRTGDWVVSTGNNDYRYLIGAVLEINKLGTPEHAAESGNDADNIHVDFTAFDYPPERIAEIEGYFSELYGEPKAFGELPLDDVIMAPDMLIRITHLGEAEITGMGNLLHNCEAFCACFPGGGELHDAKHAELVSRVNKNLTDYNEGLMCFGKQEVIDMAGKIVAMSDAHCYLTMYNRYTDDELDFFLQFQNPLEIVADEWYERRSDLDDMCYTMDAINDRRGEFLADYPLMSAAANPLPDSPISARAEEPAERPKQTLAEKLQAAGEKAKAQETHNNYKSHKREERE